MATRVLELIENRLDAGGSLSLPATNRIVYVVEGEVEPQSGGATERITPNEARHYSGSVGLQAGDGGARLWRWELTHSSEKAGGSASQTKLRAAIAIDDDAEYLMRCDRVDFPLGGIAYTHTHQGPGIRCLYMGEFDVTVDGQTKHLHPGRGVVRGGSRPRVCRGVQDRAYGIHPSDDSPASASGPKLDSLREDRGRRQAEDADLLGARGRTDRGLKR